MLGDTLIFYIYILECYNFTSFEVNLKIAIGVYYLSAINFLINKGKCSYMREWCQEPETIVQMALNYFIT